MTEFLMNNAWAAWLAVAVLFLVAEGLTTALISIWFVPGALVSALLSMLVKNVTVQVVVFLAISGVVIFLSKKFFRPSKSDRLSGLNESLIGKKAVVKESDSATEAKVLVGDVYWRAVCETPLSEGEIVTVIAVNGNILTVEKVLTEAKEC